MHKVITTIFTIITLTGLGQPASELARAISKYPDQVGYIVERTMDVEIKLNKSDEPRFYVKQKDILLVLTENIASLTSGKEYFGYGIKLNKILAYTMVPETENYRKIMVKDFTKTSEIGDGLFYDDRIALNYNFPCVCKGAKLIEETSYEIIKPFVPISFFFGSVLPVEKVRINLVMPENVNIRYKLFGSDTSKISLSKENKGKKIIYSWCANDVPAYLADDNSPSFRYYIPHIGINISGYTINNKFRPVFRDINDYYAWNYEKIKDLHTQNDPEINAMSDSIILGAKNDFEKIKKIFRWVQKNIRYVAIEDGENGFIPRPALLVLYRRYGDCKDKSSLLKALLISQGIPSSMVWLGSRELPYKYSDFPSMLTDNHMIAAYWDSIGNPHLLDGTTLNHPLEVIPSFIQGKECLIDRGAKNFLLYKIPVSRPEMNTIIDSVFLKISNDTISGEGHAYFTGEPKVEMIDQFDGTDPQKYKNIVITHIPMGNNKLDIFNVKTSDIDNIDDTLKVNFQFTLTDYANIRNANIYINLNLDKTLQDIKIKDERAQPFEQKYPFYLKFVSILQIPIDYELQKVPDVTKYQNDNYSFKLNYEQKGNKIILSKTLVINFIELRKEEFPSFAELINMLNKSYQQTLVLRKKQQ